MCNTLEGPFEILTKIQTTILQNYQVLTISLIKYTRWGSAEEWLVRLRMSAKESNYQEVDRQLKEQFIHRLNDTEIPGERTYKSESK